MVEFSCAAKVLGTQRRDREGGIADRIGWARRHHDSLDRRRAGGGGQQNGASKKGAAKAHATRKLRRRAMMRYAGRTTAGMK